MTAPEKKLSITDVIGNIPVPDGPGRRLDRPALYLPPQP